MITYIFSCPVGVDNTFCCSKVKYSLLFKATDFFTAVSLSIIVYVNTSNFCHSISSVRSVIDKKKEKKKENEMSGSFSRHGNKVASLFRHCIV